MPAPKPASKPASKPSGQPPDVMVDDHVYAVHPERGPIALRVTAVGKDGFRGVCDQNVRHGIPFDAYVGHKARAAHRFDVVDQGADGAIVRDAAGNSRFLLGKIPAPPAPGAPNKPATPKDDPLTGGLGQLAKAFEDAPMSLPIPDGRRLLLKAAGTSLKNRPGLTLKQTTDKDGTQTHRWESDGSGKPAGDGQAPMKHGDTVGFRHGQVEGQGKIVASGHAGVTLQDDGGREHKVRHEHLTGPAGGDGKGGGKTGAETEQNAVREPAPLPDKQGTQPPASGTGNGGGKPFFDPAVVAKLPPKAVQPMKDKDSLFKASAAGLEHLQTWLNKGRGIASQAGAQTMTKSPDDVTPEEWDKPGAMLFIARLKGEARSAEKVEADYGGDWSQLKDTVRGSIAVDSLDDLHGMVERLNAGGMKLAQQPKDRFAKPTPVGYRDMLLNIELPGGLIGELQLHVKSMLKAKNEGHAHYETERTLDAKMKSGTALSDEERAKLKEAQDKQTEIYGGAWDAASRVSGGGGDMAKAEGGNEFSFFEHEGAVFRRRNNGVTRSVDDVLRGKEWVPYKGSDPLEPALYGNEIPDPLAAGGETMAKAEGPRLLLMKALPAGPPADWQEGMGCRIEGRAGGFQVIGQDGTGPVQLRQVEGGPDTSNFDNSVIAFADPELLRRAPELDAPSDDGEQMTKAQIPDGRMSDLFSAPTQVKGHMKGSAYVAPYQATRHKRAAGTPEPAPVSDAEAKELSIGAFKRHDEWRKSYGKNPPSRSYAGILGSHLTALGRKVTSLDEGRILAAMSDHTRSAEASAQRETPKEPDHITQMRVRLKELSGRRYKTASDEKLEKLYSARLAADPGKWAVGHGVSYQVASGGPRQQTNRGFRITALHPEHLQATIRSVADTGLTTTGGNHDRIDDQRIYLGELRRERKYDAPQEDGMREPSAPAAPAAADASPRYFLPTLPTDKERAKAARFERQLARQRMGAGSMMKALSGMVRLILRRSR